MFHLNRIKKPARAPIEMGWVRRVENFNSASDGCALSHERPILPLDLSCIRVKREATQGVPHHRHCHCQRACACGCRLLSIAEVAPEAGEHQREELLHAPLVHLLLLVPWVGHGLTCEVKRAERQRMVRRL